MRKLDKHPTTGKG